MLVCSLIIHHFQEAGNQIQNFQDAVYWFEEVFKYCTNTFLREFVAWFYAVEELKCYTEYTKKPCKLLKIICY